MQNNRLQGEMSSKIIGGRNVYVRVRSAGDNVAVGGVGLLLAQMCKLFGARVIATAGSAEKPNWCVRPVQTT